MFHSIPDFFSGFDSLSLIWAAGGVLILALGIIVVSTLRVQSRPDTELEISELPLTVPPQPDTTRQ